jgi:hypothetical protein
MDEVFIPIGALVNGATIAPEAVEEITYWHVELESHDCCSPSAWRPLL